MGVKWVAGILMFWLVCLLISNILEKHEGYTEAQMAQIQGISQNITITTAKEPSIGGVTSSGDVNPTALTTILQAVTLNYSFLYDVNYSMTEPECSTAGGVWNSSISACQYHNYWWFVWLIFIYGPIVATLLFLIILIRQAIMGS